MSKRVKIIFPAVVLTFFLSLPSVFADDEFDQAMSELDASAPSVDSTMAHVEKKAKSLARAGEPRLVDMDLSRAVARIEALERHVADLERDIDYQDQQIRSLDRSIDDLKRRF